MTITINPTIEARFRARAQAAGISVDVYIERLADARESALEELETLALEGLNSGESFEAGPAYWQEKHRSLDERLKT
jgi:hypothetical protein